MDEARRARKNLNEKFKDNVNKILEIEREKEHVLKLVKDEA